jgi:hypothetical protein
MKKYILALLSIDVSTYYILTFVKFNKIIYAPEITNSDDTS